MTVDIPGLFATLPVPTGDSPAGRFAVYPIPTLPACSVGKDTVGNPVILIETDDAGGRGAADPILLEHLSILHNVDCRVQLPEGGVGTRRFSVVRCGGDDRQLHDFFLRALVPILGTLPPRPQRRQVVDAVNTLIELFRRVVRPPRKAVQGLWGELYVIQGAVDPAGMIRCWHTLPEDRFDFADGNLRLEIKTAGGRARTHRFSHEQLRPPAGSRAAVASVLMERSAGGESMNDLVELIRLVVSDHQLLVHLDAVIALTLGTDWRAAQTERFDRQLARESLRFFDASSIPSVPAILPPEVSEVQFRVDLTNQASALPGEWEQAGRLFAAMLPR